MDSAPLPQVQWAESAPGLDCCLEAMFLEISAVTGSGAVGRGVQRVERRTNSHLVMGLSGECCYFRPKAGERMPFSIPTGLLTVDGGSCSARFVSVVFKKPAVSQCGSERKRGRKRGSRFSIRDLGSPETSCFEESTPRISRLTPATSSASDFAPAHLSIDRPEYQLEVAMHSR